MRDPLFHGSAVAGLRILEPRSALHGAEGEKVLYLTGSIPYALTYIWGREKTGTAQAFKRPYRGLVPSLRFLESAFTGMKR